MGVTLVGNRELSLLMNWVPELLGSGEFCVFRHRVVLPKSTSSARNYVKFCLEPLRFCLEPLRFCLELRTSFRHTNGATPLGLGYIPVINR